MPDPNDKSGAPGRSAPTTLDSDDLLTRLREVLPDLLDDVHAYLVEVSPDMARFFEDARGEVEAGTDLAFGRLVELTACARRGTALLESGDLDVEEALFAEIGRTHWQRGDDLVDLLAVYQTCGRIAWRRMAEALVAADEEPATIAAVAEALFFLVDRMTSASAHGYTAEQTEGALNRARHREELVDLLLAGVTDVTVLQAAASRAGWRLPREASLVIVDDDSEAARGAVQRIDVDVLPVRREGRLGAIVPNPAAPGRRERLARALAGLGAVVSYPVPLSAIPASAAIAATAANLRRAGVLVDDPVFVADHLDAVIVHRDGPLLQALRDQALTPLADAPHVSRARLTETLGSWLRHMGDRQAVAAELSIHPQTVRYRMGLLHQMFGDALDDPETRARLMLALAWSPAARPGTARRPPTGRQRRTGPGPARHPGR